MGNRQPPVRSLLPLAVALGAATLVTAALALPAAAGPDILRIAVGSTVEWQNTGRSQHTVTGFVLA